MPDSVPDLIRRAAQTYGIPEKLALAVAEQESGFNPTLINPKKVGDEQAVGTFQILPSTAKGLGIDPFDPRQNIDGGVKYLRQLMDRHEGDLQKVLAEYGGVKTDTTYVPQVVARMGKFGTETPNAQRGAGAGPVGRGGGAGPGPPPSAITTDIPTPTNLLKTLAEPFDPRTSEGRVNLASTAGGLAVSMLPGGRIVGPLGRGMMPQIAPWIARVLGPPVAAGVAGGTERAVEQKIGTTPTTEAGGLETGAKQAAYELGGQALMWPVRRIARSFFGTRVGEAAKTGLLEEGIQTERAGRAAVASVRQAAHDRVEAARMIGQADVQAARARQAPGLARAAEQATLGKIALSDETTALIESAKKAAAERLANVELDNAAAVKEVAQQYDTLLGAPPSAAETASSVLAVVSPGRRGVERGPAQLALDEAGKRVRTAALKGPAIALEPVKEALEQMRGATYPDSLLGIVEAPVTSSASGQLTQAEFKALLLQTGNDLSKAMLDPATPSPLPKVLGLIQRAPVEAISFEDAHKLKGLLDETVNWDRTAKRKLEGITKGIRVALRRAMSGNEPYDQATAAYESLIPLYRESIGKRIIQTAQTNPDALMKLFNPENPIQAKAARDLLIKQAEVGGDPVAGERAWDAVRAAFTYRQLIAGGTKLKESGAEKLGERIQALITKYPDFARTVYHDKAGQQVLSNLAELGKAYTAATEKAAAELASTKAAGQASVAEAEALAARAKTLGTARIKAEQLPIRERAAQAIRDAREQAAGTTRQVQLEGAGAVEEAQVGAAAQNEAVRLAKARLAASSLKNARDPAQQAADAIEAAKGTLVSFRIHAVLRLLNGPKANDILEWAAYSPQNTQRLSAFMMGQLPDRAAAALVRDLAPVLAPDK